MVPDHVDVAGEPERFDRYVERCLYGPDGFYAGGGSAGRRTGDFLTSPEVGPLFGAVLTRAIDSVWRAAGRPDPFTVFDVGCGPGTLLKAVAVAVRDLGGRPWNLVGVDRVAGPGAAVDALPEELTDSVVVANELLDNLPFRVVERRADGFVELHVRPGGDPGPGGDSGPGSDSGSGGDSGPGGDPGSGGGEASEVLLATELELDIPIGTRAPYLDQARRWVESVLARAPAAVLAFDYGAPTTAELAARGGWLRTYRSHQRGDDPLQHPGRSDITTDVAWDQLPTPDRLQTQADFLGLWGIAELVEQGRAHWRRHAARPDLTAMRMRSRAAEAGALVDPEGLGGWLVAGWGRTWVEPG